MPSDNGSAMSGHDGLPAALREDATLLALYDYWQSRRGTRPFPNRADISPHGLGPKLLPHVGLAELDAGDLRNSRMRLVGTAIVEGLGLDPTGKQVGDYAHGEYLEFMVSLAADMLRHRRPMLGESAFRLREKRFLMVRRLYLPLSHGSSEPTMLLFGQTFYHPADPADLDRVTRLLL
ncbi:MAG: PAS domain-containing protein [Alphaproteobacteria bacterium]|nr:PAS domain-containing protein [Alphaproteobacteria bacterium]